MQVSPPAVKLQYTLKESPEQPWLGSIQYSPKMKDKGFASNNDIFKKSHVLLPSNAALKDFQLKSYNSSIFKAEN